MRTVQKNRKDIDVLKVFTCYMTCGDNSDIAAV